MKNLFKLKSILFGVAVSLSSLTFGATQGADAIRDWFRDNWFGSMPERPADEAIGSNSVSCAAGRICIDISESLPARASCTNPVAVFVFGDHFNAETSKDHLAHYPNIPTNTITARGYAYVSFNFNDITPNDYAELADEPKLLARNKLYREYGAKGTLAAWAWGFSRVVDWIETRPELDAHRIAIVGHSRGGKAALWAGACDQRITLTIANDSGAGGARLMRQPLPEAERIADFRRNGVGHWFADAFHAYAGREAELPYDSADLMGLIAPRLLYVAIADEDTWGGPAGEFAAVRQATLARTKTFPYADYPGAGAFASRGPVGYHIRAGKHKLLPQDWVRFMDFADSHGWYQRDHAKTAPIAAADWAGKSVAVLGDSLSDPNIGWWKHWWKWVGEELGCKMRAYAVNGRQWNDVPRQVDALAKAGGPVDAFLIFMGTNDYNSNVPLGTWWTETETTVNHNGREVKARQRIPVEDAKTVRGRINIALKKIKTEYPRCQVVLMTPIRRGFFTCGSTNVQPEDSYSNELGLFIGDYAQVVREAGQVWSVPVIDAYAESGLVPSLPSQTDCCNRPTTDRLHLSTEGCRRLAATVITKLRTMPATFR